MRGHKGDTWDSQCLHGCVQPCVVAGQHPPNPPARPLKGLCGRTRSSRSFSCAMGLYHPKCLNIYCPVSPGWRVPRKTVVYPLTLA